MIKNYSECERCKHNKVCAYKELQKEVLNKMNGRLDNCCSPNIFKFTFECKEYELIETIARKENPWYD